MGSMGIEQWSPIAAHNGDLLYALINSGDNVYHLMNSKGPDQPVHLHRLVRSFAVRYTFTFRLSRNCFYKCNKEVIRVVI